MIIIIWRTGLILYTLISSGVIIWDLKKQHEYYLDKGYSPEEAVALALQDEAAEIAMQIATPPQGKIAIKLAEKFLLNPEVAKLIVKTSVEIAKEITVNASHGTLKSGEIKKTVLEIEKKVYAEVKDVLKDFPDVNVVDKITVPDQVQKVIENYQRQSTNIPSSSPSQPAERILPDTEPVAEEGVQNFPKINSPEAQTSTRPVLKGSVEKTVLQDDSKARLDDFLQKGQQLRDSIDEHNKLTPEEIGKQIADPKSAPAKTKITQEHVNQAGEIVEKIYSPQNQAERQEMINDIQKIEGFKNISEQEIKRVIKQKGAKILAQNQSLKEQGLPVKELKDIYRESINELVNTDKSIETGKQIAKSISRTSIPSDGIEPSYLPEAGQISPDTAVISGALETNESFTSLADRIMEWAKEQLKEKAKEKAQDVILEVFGKILNKPTPELSPMPEPAPSPQESSINRAISAGGGDVHVKGHVRDGHPVKAYDRSRPS